MSERLIVGFVGLALTAAGTCVGAATVADGGTHRWPLRVAGVVGAVFAAVGLAMASSGLAVAAVVGGGRHLAAAGYGLAWAGMVAAVVMIAAPSDRLAAMGAGLVGLGAAPGAAASGAVLLAHQTVGGLDPGYAAEVVGLGLDVWQLCFGVAFGAFLLWLLLAEVEESGRVAAGRGGRPHSTRRSVTYASLVVAAVGAIALVLQPDGTRSLAGLRWTAWTAAAALGVGIFRLLRRGLPVGSVEVRRVLWATSLIGVGAALLVWLSVPLAVIYLLGAIWPATHGEAIGTLIMLVLAVLTVRRLERGGSPKAVILIAAPIATGLVVGVLGTALPGTMLRALAPGSPLFDGAKAVTEWMTTELPNSFGLMVLLVAVLLLLVVGMMRRRPIAFLGAGVLFTWMAVQGAPRVLADLSGSGPATPWLPTPESVVVAYTAVLLVALATPRLAVHVSAKAAPAAVALFVVVFGQLPTPSDRDPWFSIALAVPMALFLLFRLGAVLRRDDGGRVGLLMLGWLGLALVVAALDVAGGRLVPGRPSVLLVIDLYMVLPASVLVLAARRDPGGGAGSSHTG